MTIKQRLAFRFSIIVGIILVAFSVAIFYFSASYRRAEFSTRLKDKALTMVGLLVDVDEVDMSMLRIIHQNSRDLLPEEVTRIYDIHGKLLFGTTESPLAERLDEIAHHPYDRDEVELTENKRQIVRISFLGKNDRFTVVASAFDKYGYSKLVFLRSILIIGCIVAEIITVVLSLGYARQALQPITGVIQQVREISLNNLRKRVTTQNSNDEIAKLASEFNLMLDKLASAFELERSFLSNASHELRTPLTAITGQISVALMDDRINSSGKEALQSVYQDIRDLNKLSNGLLDLAQANLDVSEFKVLPLRIDELIGACQAEVKKLNGDFEILIEFDEFPEDDSYLMVLANEHLLKSALNNLLENACKYSSDHRAVLRFAASDERIRISIKDHGIGIHQADMPYVFAPFFRAQNSKGFIGHGIGLTLAEKIVRIHSGEIAIASEVGIGTIVTVTLPVYQQSSGS